MKCIFREICESFVSGTTQNLKMGMESAAETSRVLGLSQTTYSGQLIIILSIFIFLRFVSLLLILLLLVFLLFRLCHFLCLSIHSLSLSYCNSRAPTRCSDS
jgi:hypothetical protein